MVYQTKNLSVFKRVLNKPLPAKSTWMKSEDFKQINEQQNGGGHDNQKPLFFKEASDLLENGVHKKFSFADNSQTRAFLLTI